LAFGVLQLQRRTAVSPIEDIMTTLAFIEGLGSPVHWIIVLVVALLLFGRRMPEVGRSLGMGISEFKKGLREAGESSMTQPPAATNDPYARRPEALPSDRREAAPRIDPPQRTVRAEVRTSRQDLVD
jgi:sec-independent protein translocase protein TatA